MNGGSGASAEPFASGGQVLGWLQRGADPALLNHSRPYISWDSSE
jgi:hypothetical protein